MAKYIKLENAVETTWMILRGLGYKREENTQLARTVLDVFASAPNEERREKTSGKWIEEDDGYDHVFYSCSVCGAGICTIDETPIEYGWKYCPECGSKMEELVRLHEDEEDED